MVAPSQALNPEKKEHNDTDVELQLSDEKKALTENTLAEDDYSTSPYNVTTVPVIRVQRQQAKARRRIWLPILIFIAMILGFTLCVLGSIRLYKSIYYVKGSDANYKGRCGVGLVQRQKMNYSALVGETTPNPTKFYEDIEIHGSIETFYVESLGNSSAATFRNDFDKNFTAIRDELKKLCLLVPFPDEFMTGLIPSPAKFSQLLADHSYDASLVNAKDEHYSFGTLVDDVSRLFGNALGELCQDFKSYTAVPQPAKPVPTAAPTTTTQAPVTDTYYLMFPGGDSIYSYHFTYPTYEDYYESY